MTNTKKDFADVMEEEAQIELEAMIESLPQAELVQFKQPAEEAKEEVKKEIKPKAEVRAGGGVQFLSVHDIESAFRLAQAFVEAGTIPACYKAAKNENGDKCVANKQVQAARIMMAMQMGAEVGMPPVQSIQSIMIVNDTPALWGDAQLALALNSGLLEEMSEVIEGEVQNEFVAKCTIKRKGMEAITRSFSWQEAVAAGLTTKYGSLYSKYPKRMLTMRARAFALRDRFTDVLKGFTHCVEELNEMIDITPMNKRAEIHAQLENLNTNNEVSEL